MIHCVFVGPFKDGRLKDLCRDHENKLKRLWPVSVMEIPEKVEGILKFIESKKAKGLLVSLDPHGKAVDSETFFRWVTSSSRDLYFLVWGAEGPPQAVRKMGLESRSLSPMTYSHELARVLLMEQLYRSGTLLKGHPYAK